MNTKPTKNKPSKICNETIHPGERLSLAMPLPQLFSCAPLYMPIKVIHGKYAGPTLLVVAAMHGNEVNGTEIINRLLEMPLVAKLKGTLVAVPVLNVYGLMNRARTLPGGINLDQCFPGKKHGSNAARLAHIFASEIFSVADMCIDLQTGPLNYSNLPHIFVDESDSESKALAKTFNAPVVLEVKSKSGSLARHALDLKKPYMIYEAGEAMRFDRYSIKIGVDGILSIMKKMDMLPERSPKKERPGKSLFAKTNTWVHSVTSGISHTKLKLGEYVEKGDVLSVVKDPFGVKEDTVIKSHYEGIVISKNNQPLVYEGEALFELALFSEMQQAVSDLEKWQDYKEEIVKPT